MKSPQGDSASAGEVEVNQDITLQQKCVLEVLFHLHGGHSSITSDTVATFTPYAHVLFVRNNFQAYFIGPVLIFFFNIYIRYFVFKIVWIEN